MNKKTKTYRLLVVAIIGLIFISSLIGSIICAIIYDDAIFRIWCNIVAIIAIVHLIFEDHYRTKDLKASDTRCRFSLKILYMVNTLLIMQWVALELGLVAELIVGIASCLLLKKVVFKYIDKEDETEA